MRAAIREVETLAEEGLTQEQFETQRDFLKKYVYQFATTTSARLGYAIDDRFYGVDGHLKKFRATMNELTVDDVNAAIRKYLQAENMVIAMVTADAKGMKEALVGGAPSPMDYGELEKSKAVLKEDKVIEKYPLKIAAENVTIVPVDEMFAK